jgi:hypothetical protein
VPDEINIDKKLRMAEIRSHGRVTTEDILKSIDVVTKLHVDGVIDKVLVDTTGQKNMPNVGSIFNITKMFPLNLKIALLAKTSQSTLEELEFTELTSYNKGKQVKLFYSKVEAMKWLSK